MNVILNSQLTTSYLPIEIIIPELKKKLNDITIPYKNIYIKSAYDVERNFITKEIIKENKVDKESLYIYIDMYIYGSKQQSRCNSKTIYGYTYRGDIALWTSAQESNIIFTPEDIDIAEFINNTILIHYDIFENNGIEIATSILANIIKDYIMLTTLDKEELEKIKYEKMLANILKVIKNANENELRREHDRLVMITSDISRYTDGLARLYKEQQQIMKRIKATQKASDEKQDKIKKDLEQILALDKIRSITSSNDGKTLNVRTELLYGYTQHNRCFKLAPYNIIIDFIDGLIRFDCPQAFKRRSCWSDNCPHPHISTGGEACFGNIASTIAQLLADMELFALITILLNYLESINVEDIAGEYCTNWDEVDPDTHELIREGRINKESDYYDTLTHEGRYLCGVCGEYVDDAVYCDACEHYVCREHAVYIQDVQEWGCVECDDIVYCEQCGKYYTEDYITHCDECDTQICMDCAVYDDEFVFCSDECRNAFFEDEEEAVACTWCETIIDESALYTCESCGRQGCSHCITLNGDKYECPDCRGDLDV